jgi:hypothetical protein
MKPVIDRDYFESKSLEEILRSKKVKPFKRGVKNNALSDPKLWEGFDEWLADQRKERGGTKRL